MLTIAVHAVSLTALHTVSVWIMPWVCIFQNGFLGGVLFEFDLPGVVIKLGLYLLRSADFKPLTACAHFKSLSTPNAHWQIPILWKLNLIWLIKEHKEVFFSIRYYLLFIIFYGKTCQSNHKTHGYWS